ncbi:MAG: TonB-dependent receptor [Pyrinomonadaceae bacterium]
MSSTLVKIIRISMVLIAIMASIQMIAGQETRGAIRGSVLDPNGAPIAGAKVVVSDPARGSAVSVTSNGEGFFQVNYLLSGKYSITVEVQGFKKLLRENVTVDIGNTIQVDLPLEVGGATETVTVTSDIQQLNTENGSVSQTIDAKRMADLPLSKGDPYKLIGTSTGVTYTGSARLDRPFEPTHIVGYAMDGTRGNRSDLTIDGAPSTATANGNEVIASYVPPSDIIQEFKVQTATFDAQFGNTEGGVTSISIKSGTNALHGSGYYFGEPISLAANDVFGKARGQSIVQTVSKRYGGSINGPVRIPKLYNGKDKTFFLFGWESIRDTRPRFDAAATTWVPTAKLRIGDFSDYLPTGTGTCASPNANAVCIFNPFTRVGTGAGTAFAGNIIPDNLISPVAKAVLTYYSLPKTAGLSGNLADSTLTEKTRKYDNFTFRIDQNITKNNRFFIRGSYYDRDSFYNDYMGTAATGNVFGFKSRQGVVDDVQILNGSTVLNVRYGFNRFIRIGEQREEAQGFDLTKLAFPSAYNNLTSSIIRRFPRFDFPSGQMFSTGFGNEFRPVSSHAPSVTLNKTFNTHSTKFGAELRVYREDDSFTSNDQTAQFIFDNTYTRASSSSTADVNGLQAYAAFLLGLPTTAQIVRRADYSEYSKTYGLFAQDDWKVTKNLTLNLGVRYDIETPLVERQNKSIAGFDASYVQQAIQDQARANLTANPVSVAVTGTNTVAIDPASFNVRGRLIFASSDNPELYKTPKNTILPRFGAAYKLSDSTVLRGGFGMFAGFLGERRGDVIQPGYTRTTQVALTTSALGASIPQNIATGFLNTAILEPVGNAQGALTGLGGAISFFNQNPKVSKQMRYQFGVQHELPKGFFLELMYVGNYGYDIEIARNINAVPLQYLNGDNSRSTAMVANNTKLGTNNTCAVNVCTGGVRNPFTGITINGVNPFAGTGFVNATGSVALSQLLRPFPAFGDITTSVNDGKSWYNSAQIVVSKRLASGFQGQVSYTFSKWIQATEYLNAADALPTKMIGDQDVPHRLAMNFTYQLPFGKGARFGNDANGWTNALIGGWQVTGVYQYQSGFPIAFGTDLFFNGGRVGLPRKNTSTWFDTANFVSVLNATATNATPVSHIRSFPLRFSDVRRDTINNVDLSLLKDIRFNETMKLRLTLELFNALNSAYLPAANTNPTNNVVLTTAVASGFGTVSGATQDNYARRAQLGIKFVF